MKKRTAEHGEKIEALEPRRGESSAAYAAFLRFAWMGGPGYGDLAALLRRPSSTVRTWAAQHKWQERLKEIGAVTSPSLLRPGREAEVGAAIDWRTRVRELREREWQMHEKLIEAGRRVLGQLEEKAPAASYSDLVKVLDLASKIGRLAADLATGKAEVSGDERAPIRIEFEAALKKIYGTPATVIDIPNIGNP